MEKRNLEIKIADYLDGKLSEPDHKAFEQQLKSDKYLQKEVEAYQQLFDAFTDEKPILPSNRLHSNFEQLLEREKANTVKVVSIQSKSRNGGVQIMRIAASIAVLISVFFLGRFSESQKTKETLAIVQNEQLQLKQTAMISLMENQSASKRIQGVQYIEAIESPNAAVVEALVERMLTDENTNVRLTAMEALSRFTASENVTAAFVEALQTEKDPGIQVALIQQLVKMEEKKAIEPMKELLEREDTQLFIKEEINTGLPKII